MKEFFVLENLSYEYESIDEEEATVLALSGVNLTVNRGEFVAIIGSNGSGKSTLAKQFNALLLPKSGKCLVDGLDTSDLDNLWDIRQNVGMVFQNPDNQIVAAVVEEDVAFGPENLGVNPDEIRQRVMDALKMVGMEEYKEHGPHLLSGGQKQRIAIAGVLAMKPKCIIFDESTAMLDPVGRKEVLKTLHLLNKEQGFTIVLVTHFMEEAAEADRIIVMDRGQKIMDDIPAKIFCRVEELRNVGLAVPAVAEISYYLKEKGITIPEEVLFSEQLAVALCP